MLSTGRIVLFIPVGQVASPNPSEPILSDGLHTSVKFADVCCGTISIRRHVPSWRSSRMIEMESDRAVGKSS